MHDEANFAKRTHPATGCIGLLIQFSTSDLLASKSVRSPVVSKEGRWRIAP
jgi:hypothetical protein